jgi:hypothetical protein
MIILEGPDGAGKTTLLANLLDQFPGIEQHAKASTSMGGPVEHIELWTTTDLKTWNLQPLSFYDRHPMFSETLYSQIVRKKGNDWFTSQDAVDLGEKTILLTGLTVFCLPKWETVERNVKAEEQMDGVLDNLYELYETYRIWAVTLAKKYPNNIFVYDYERVQDYADLVKVITAHEVKWNRRAEGKIA